MLGLVLLVATTTCVSGCTLHDILFEIFSDAYSEGGTTSWEKKYHYDQQLEAWDNYEP